MYFSSTINIYLLSILQRHCIVIVTLVTLHRKCQNSYEGTKWKSVTSVADEE